MAQFVKHSGCPSCMSRDNLATYDDGSQWCFGCHYYVPPKHISRSLVEPRSENSSEIRPLPDDVDFNFSEKALDWLQTYQVTPEELVRHNVVFSERRQQIIYKFCDGDNLLGWQARNIMPGKSRYFTQGNVSTMLPIYHCMAPARFPSTCVLVEDCVSAIKIARLSDSMPCLSSGIPPDKLKRVAGLYERLIIWLDSNMISHAVKMAEQVKMMGVQASARYTHLDPKYYKTEEIESFLQEALDNCS